VGRCRPDQQALGIGERLLKLLPAARLEVMPAGEHDLAVRHADSVAAIVAAHLRA